MLMMEDVENEIPLMDDLLEASSSESEGQGVMEEDADDPTIEIEGTSKDKLTSSLEHSTHNDEVETDDTLKEMRQLEQMGKKDEILKNVKSHNNEGSEEKSTPEKASHQGSTGEEPQSDHSSEGEDAESRQKKKKKSDRRKKSKKKGKDDNKAKVFNPRNVPYAPHDLKNFVTQAPREGKGCIVRCFIERSVTASNKVRCG